jgi:hypothetical protein
MFVWEREIYINLLIEDIESKKQEQSNNNPFNIFPQ